MHLWFSVWSTCEFFKKLCSFSKNVEDQKQIELAAILFVPIVSVHDKYLGLPTYIGRARTDTFQYIKDRLFTKLKGWQEKLLSDAGKEILIRVVAQALPSHAMSCFLLTNNFCTDLQQMCARFWWGSSTDQRKIHWKSWAGLCVPKERGGLGFWDLHAFNLSLLAKQGWHILENPGSLIAPIYKARYFPQSSFLEAHDPVFPSYSWRSIWPTRDLLLQGMRWQIGSGTEITTWREPWIPKPPAYLPLSSSLEGSTESVVADYILPSRVWDK